MDEAGWKSSNRDRWEDLEDGKVVMGKERAKKKGCSALRDAGLAGPVIPLH